MATQLKTDGSSVVLTGTGRDGRFTLQQMQAAVGGYIEAVPGTNHRAWCNEDGLRMQLSLNRMASLMFGQQLVGDVLVMDPADKYEGDEEETEAEVAAERAADEEDERESQNSYDEHRAGVRNHWRGEGKKQRESAAHDWH